MIVALMLGGWVIGALLLAAWTAGITVVNPIEEWKQYKRIKARTRIIDNGFAKLLDWDDYSLEYMPDDFYVLRDEVKEWCKANLVGEYGLQQPKDIDDPVQIWFDDANDATLFKLRWC